MENTEKFDQVMDEEVAKLEEQVKMHEDIREDHFPLWWQIDKDIYRLVFSGM